MYFEVREPFYALLKTDNLEVAISVYKEEVNNSLERTNFVEVSEQEAMSKFFFEAGNLNMSYGQALSFFEEENITLIINEDEIAF